MLSALEEKKGRKSLLLFLETKKPVTRVNQNEFRLRNWTLNQPMRCTLFFHPPIFIGVPA